MVPAMSELQTALLAIGFGVIIAVYAFGWWQQRKYRRKFGAAFKASHADALYQESAEPRRGGFDGTPSHSTWLSKNDNQVAGYETRPDENAEDATGDAI